MCETADTHWQLQRNYLPCSCRFIHVYYIMPSSLRQLGPKPVLEQPPEPPPQQTQQAMHKPMPPAHMVFVKPYLTPLLKTTQPNITPEYLQKHGIRRRRLDFYSGATLLPTLPKPDPTAQAYTQLFPYGDMVECVRHNKPWTSWDNGPHHTLHYDENLDGWWHALSITRHLNRFLEGHYDSDNSLGLISTTGWEAVG